MQIHPDMPSAGVKSWGQVDKVPTMKVVQDLPLNQKNQPSNTVQAQLEKNDVELFEMVRFKIVSRGARGINGIRRVFKIMDDDCSKCLNRAEFSKAMQDYRITTDTNEVNRIFNLFDSDRSGSINYDEFLRAVVGEMNERRRSLVALAFQKFDRDGNGVVNVEDLKGRYNAS